MPVVPCCGADVPWWVAMPTHALRSPLWDPGNLCRGEASPHLNFDASTQQLSKDTAALHVRRPTE